MLQILSALRHKCAIGFVGGSDLVKQQEQLGTPQLPVTALFDFSFAENGLTAYRLGEQLASQSFVGWLGEERYKKLVNFVLRYLADVECPVKRGTFVEFRYVDSLKITYCRQGADLHNQKRNGEHLPNRPQCQHTRKE